MDKYEFRISVSPAGNTDFDKLRERWQKHHVHNEKKSGNSEHHRSKRSISLERNVETLVVVDSKMMQYYDNEDVENYVLTIMNIVSTPSFIIDTVCPHYNALFRVHDIEPCYKRSLLYI